MITPESLDAMRELLGDMQQPLDAELEPWVEEDGPFGRQLRHPLVYQVPMHSPGLANKQLAYKKGALHKALKQHDWHSVVFLHERPYRLAAFLRYVLPLGERIMPLAHCDPEIRNLAAEIWTDSENINQHLDEWRALFADWKPNDPLLLGYDETDEFLLLPDPLTVYRAGIDDGDWSWTLDPKVAEFFAHRFGVEAPILRATAAKRDVFGYLTHRNEAEVLVRLGAATDIEPYREDT